MRAVESLMTAKTGKTEPSAVSNIDFGNYARKVGGCIRRKQGCQAREKSCKKKSAKYILKK